MVGGGRGEWPARGLYRCVRSDNGVVVLEAVAASGGGRGRLGLRLLSEMCKKGWVGMNRRP